jgi:hypothetical protein
MNELTASMAKVAANPPKRPCSNCERSNGANTPTQTLNPIKNERSDPLDQLRVITSILCGVTHDNTTGARINKQYAAMQGLGQ